MNIMDVLIDFIEETRKCSNEDEYFKAFSAAVRKLGFIAESYWPERLDDESILKFQNSIYTNANPALDQFYLDRNLAKEDPLLAYAQRTGKATLWHELIEEVSLSKDYKEFLDMVFSSGYKSGVLVPIYAKNGRVAVVRTGMETQNPDLTPDTIQCLKLISYHLHQCIEALQDDIEEEHTELSLSQREIEVLRWIAEGKSISVVGEILNISEHTVDTYLRRSYQKLGVNSRIAAIIKATSLGIISPDFVNNS